MSDTFASSFALITVVVDDEDGVDVDDDEDAAMSAAVDKADVNGSDAAVDRVEIRGCDAVAAVVVDEVEVDVLRDDNELDDEEDDDDDTKVSASVLVASNSAVDERVAEDEDEVDDGVGVADLDGDGDALAAAAVTRGSLPLVDVDALPNADLNLDSVSLSSDA